MEWEGGGGGGTEARGRGTPPPAFTGARGEPRAAFLYHQDANVRKKWFASSEPTTGAAVRARAS